MKQKILIAFISIGMILNAQAQSKIKFGTQVNYYLPTTNQKNSLTPFLFLDNAVSAGITATYITSKSRVSWPLSIDYISGTNSKDAPAVYAKDNNIIYTSYAYSKSKPSGLSILAGPSFALFPKSKLPLMWLQLQAGVLFTNSQSIQYMLDQNIVEKEVRADPISFNYKPTLSIVVFKTQKIMGKINLSYSRFGGFGFGLGITERDCTGAPCWKCDGNYCTRDKIIED